MKADTWLFHHARKCIRQWDRDENERVQDDAAAGSHSSSPPSGMPVRWWRPDSNASRAMRFTAAPACSNERMRLACALLLFLLPVHAQTETELFAKARANGERFHASISAAERLMRAWLRHADPQTLLLPDRINGAQRIYTPHNSGADLYPYLILTAHLTDRSLYDGRMLEMLRNEIRFTTHPSGIPGNYNLVTRQLDKESLFGAGEYAKDGLLTVTEYLGRTPWFYRMADMTGAAIATVQLPVNDAELDGDFLQTLVRLASMTGDRRYLEAARRIGDAYIRDLLPKMDRLKLRDHGNEIVVGLTLLYCLERDLEGERFVHHRTAIAALLDRIMRSANPDGMLYNIIDWKTLKPVDERLSDNWGYVYGAMYAFYQATGETKYRDAVVRVLRNLPKYRNYAWEPSSNARDKALGSFDGYADSIESALYLVNREPVPEALDWIDSEMKVMLGMQRSDGHVEDWYGEGNFNRTALLYALMKSQGVRPVEWRPGTKAGAVRDGKRLLLSIESPEPARFSFDFDRHRSVLNLRQNYVRLNEFPEWFVVEMSRIYRVRRRESVEGLSRLGSELVEGIALDAGEWIIEPQ